MPDYTLVANPLLIVNCVLNVVASIVVIVTIFLLVQLPSVDGRKSANKFNVYIQIILIMSVCQGLTDATLFLNYGCHSPGINRDFCKEGYIIVFFSALYATNAWSNVLSCLLAYIILTRKSIDLDRCRIPLVVGVFIFSIGTATTLVTQVDEWLIALDSVRVCQIVLNFLLIGTIWRTILGKGQLLITDFANRHRDPLYVLTKKVSFYPVIQSMTSLSACLYDFQYGPTTNFTNVDASLQQAIFFFVFVVVQPLGGILTLWVFFSTQKGAKEVLLGFLSGKSVANVGSELYAEDEARRLARRDISSHYISRDSIAQSAESRQSSIADQEARPTKSSGTLPTTSSGKTAWTDRDSYYYDFNEGELVEEIILLNEEAESQRIKKLDGGSIHLSPLQSSIVGSYEKDESPALSHVNP